MSVPGSSLPARLRRGIAARVRIDTRSLAVFRVFVGLLVIADVLLRSRNFGFLYSESGVVPQALAEARTPEHAVSVYFFTQDATVIAALFALQALIAIVLIVGYRTRIALLLTFLGVVSLDFHNPFVLSYADTLFRLVLFWALFLPLGERWSIDAIHADGPRRESIASLATAAILFQVVVMYVVNGYHKTLETLWTSGHATPLIFGLDDMTFLLAGVLRQFPTALQYGGLLWFYLLVCGWLLLVLHGRLRLPLVALLMGGHASFALTVRIGAFAYVALAALVLFVQEPFWRDATAVLRHLDVYDPYVSGVRGRLERAGERLAGVLPAVQIDGTYEVHVDGEPYRRFHADVVTATIYLTVLFSAILFVFVFPGVEGLAYVDGVEETVGEVPDPYDHVYDPFPNVGVSQPTWTVFAPTPRTTDRYYVFPARTADGEYLDVYNDGRELTYDRPHEMGGLHNQYGSYRERFYMNTIRRDGEVGGAPPQLAEYLCETYEEEHGIELTHINMYAISEPIADWDAIDEPENRERRSSAIYAHGCGDHRPEEFHPPDF